MKVTGKAVPVQARKQRGRKTKAKQRGRDRIEFRVRENKGAGIELNSGWARALYSNSLSRLKNAHPQRPQCGRCSLWLLRCAAVAGDGTQRAC